MKKFLSLFLALVLCVCLTAPAFAAETTIELNNEVWGEKEEVSVKLSDVVSTAEYNTMMGTSTVYTVNTGTVLSVVSSNKDATGFFFNEAKVWEDGGLYPIDPLADPAFKDGRSVTLDQTGMFEINAAYLDTSDPGYHYNRGFGNVFYVNVVGGSNAAPSAPTPADKPAATPAPAVSATPLATGAGTYTVKKGDSLDLIALNYYGSYHYAKALRQANLGVFKANDWVLKEGMTLTLPQKLGNKSLLTYPTAGAGETLYTVKAGDSLSAIAKAQYGDASKYPLIFQRNSDRLTNASTIFVGQVIVLPAV